MAFDRGALPGFLVRYIAACPAVESLLVHPSQYMAACKQVRKVGSKLWAAAAAVRQMNV